MSYAADIARDVREAVRNAKDAGRLHALPQGARVTVRSETGSMYAAAQVTISGVSAEWAWKDGNVGEGRTLTDAALQVTNRLRHYASQAADGRAWGDVVIQHDEYRITVGQGWTPDSYRPGQD
jgi:hypothetical protein